MSKTYVSLLGWFSYLIAGSLFGAASSDARADDDLFSKFAIETPFADSATPEDSGSSDTQPSRITGASSLSAVLEDARLKTRSISTRVVATELKQDEWTIPMHITVHYEEDQLEVALLLKSLGSDYDESTISGEKLLELMDASRNHAPAFFAYDASKKRIELRQRISNRGLSSEKLKRHLERLAAIAVDNEAAWDLVTKAAAPTAQTAAGDPPTADAGSTTSTQPTAPALSAQSLVGTWAADRGKNEAIAFQLGSDGKFILVIAKGTTTTRSSGTFSLQDQTLQLNGDDGTKLSGSVAMQSGKAFELQLPGAAAPLKFTKE